MNHIEVTERMVDAAIAASRTTGLPLVRRTARLMVERALDVMQEDAELALSPRQTEVLQLLAKGYTRGQIGYSLGIGKETAKSHVRGILQRLGAHTSPQAVAIAYERGILTRTGGA
jgi:DNA-binding NarL/FixJ family response regulator